MSEKKPAYCDTDAYLDRRSTNLSKASVKGRHFHASEFDWSRPEYAIDVVKTVDPDTGKIKVEVPDNEINNRWALHPRIHPIAAHEWHQKSLTQAQRNLFGIQMYAHTFAAGAQFEMGLNAGIMADVARGTVSSRKRNRSWAQYALDEAAEESNHIKLFAGFINHANEAGIETTDGMPKWFRSLGIAGLALFATAEPNGFWTGVYGGESPIDMIQHRMIALHESGESPLPEVLEDIIRIHIDEEARHISHVRDRLARLTGKDEQGRQKMSPRKQLTYSSTSALTYKLAEVLIAIPDKNAQRIMNIPSHVTKETRKSAETKQFMKDLLGDVREFCYETDLLDNPVGRQTWKMLGIHDEQHLKELRAKAEKKGLPPSDYRDLSWLKVGRIMLTGKA